VSALEMFGFFRDDSIAGSASPVWSLVWRVRIAGNEGKDIEVDVECAAEANLPFFGTILALTLALQRRRSQNGSYLLGEYGCDSGDNVPARQEAGFGHRHQVRPVMPSVQPSWMLTRSRCSSSFLVDAL
jgi:hypothetical protein